MFWGVEEPRIRQLSTSSQVMQGLTINTCSGSVVKGHGVELTSRTSSRENVAG
jgi:hypothetical protein